MTDQAKLVEELPRLREIAEKATPGNLDTSDHIGGGYYQCPACNGDGEIDGEQFTNFDGFALGVQFFGVGNEFAAYESFFRAFRPETVIHILDLLASKDGEIAALTHERDVAYESQRRDARYRAEAEAQAEAAEALTLSLRAENERLRGALEPFAAVADVDIGEDETDEDFFRPANRDYAKAPPIMVGHMRAARAALSQSTGDTK